jgi:uncharacterized protein YciI
MNGLRREGKMLANGPFDDQTDESLRGLCVMACDADEARELMQDDPSVAAGRLAPEVFVWLMPVGLARFGPA